MFPGVEVGSQGVERTVCLVVVDWNAARLSAMFGELTGQKAGDWRWAWKRGWSQESEELELDEAWRRLLAIVEVGDMTR
jgi:hypothetical protein